MRGVISCSRFRFFFDDTMPLRLSETEASFFLLHGGTTALKERLLQAVATAQVKTEQQQFYYAQSLCCLYFPVQKQVFLDADLLTLLPRLGCPELDTRHIPLHHCYDRNVLRTHAEAIRYSFTELQENSEHTILLQTAAEQAFSHFCMLTETAVRADALPTLPLPEHAHESGTLQVRQLQGCTPEGILMQPLACGLEYNRPAGSLVYCRQQPAGTTFTGSRPKRLAQHSLHASPASRHAASAAAFTRTKTSLYYTGQFIRRALSGLRHHFPTKLLSGTLIAI